MQQQLMEAFAGRTGLTSDAEPDRYLWTDAYAVGNLVTLAEDTGDEAWLELAEELVGQVHRVLGRHRDDDPRTGWISGLSDDEGADHPTAGGLRIGKARPERGPDEPLDRQAEWDRDGQYFHYLTKWMHALDVLHRRGRGDRYARWARELAEAAHQGFVHGDRMVWKASIDLSRPLVPSMGHHDPLDGLITCQQLQASGADLGEACAAYARIARGRSWATDDPLGLGGLLFDAHRVAQMTARGNLDGAERLAGLLEDAGSGLARYQRSGALDRPVPYRLAFRELGLAIGLHAVPAMKSLASEHPGALGDPIPDRLGKLGRHQHLCETIESTWRQDQARRTEAWTDHRDINAVMLATSLAPGGFLTLPPPPG